MASRKGTTRLLDFEVTNRRLEQIRMAKIALKAKLGHEIATIAEVEHISKEEVERVLVEHFGFEIEKGKALYPGDEKSFDRKLMALIS
jgi:methyl coenzyme M reductase subunit D